MESILTAVIGIVCIVLGLSHRKGNLSSLHSYHRKRVTEEDRLPFGKLVGLGTILIGVSLLLTAGLFFMARHTQETRYALLGDVVMAVGLVVGMAISFYAMIKYNKGIF